MTSRAAGLLLAGPLLLAQWYDAGHRLPPEYVPRAVGWLKDNLR